MLQVSKVIVVNFQSFPTLGILRRGGFVAAESNDFARGVVTGPSTDKCLKGVAGPPSALLCRCVGAGLAPTGGTTNTPSSAEGVVSRVGHVETTGVVETTPANKAKRSVTWVKSEGATCGRQVALESPAHNLLMVAKESKHFPDAVEGLPRQDLWCLDVEARVRHWLSPHVQRYCSPLRVREGYPIKRHKTAACVWERVRC